MHARPWATPEIVPYACWVSGCQVQQTLTRAASNSSTTVIPMYSANSVGTTGRAYIRSWTALYHMKYWFHRADCHTKLCSPQDCMPHGLRLLVTHTAPWTDTLSVRNAVFGVVPTKGSYVRTYVHAQHTCMLYTGQQTCGSYVHRCMTVDNMIRSQMPQYCITYRTTDA